MLLGHLFNLVDGNLRSLFEPTVDFFFICRHVGRVLGDVNIELHAIPRKEALNDRLTLLDYQSYRKGLCIEHSFDDDDHA